VSEQAIRKVLIVGGGTAGWMTAAVLARVFPSERLSITLVESAEIGIVGVGEATVPILQQLNRFLGISERDFLKATGGTYKLGIEFRGWGSVGNTFFHGFGDYGPPIFGVPPHHHWRKLRELGQAPALDDFSMPYAMARRGRFTVHPSSNENPALSYSYAFHFDSALYGQFLREVAEKSGVTRVEGKIVDVSRDAETGFISSVSLEGERTLDADLFVDCSGFRGLLIEQALETGYEDWRKWLPCDSAVAVGTEVTSAPTPFTRSTAHPTGWQWRIPLQHRVGNGHVYATEFASDDEAHETLLANLDAKAIGDPRLLRFAAGRRKKAWNGNVVAIGLSAGFMEPLESTSIQLIQTGAIRLIEHFPTHGFDPAAIEEYNRVTANEHERIRDFLIAHYCLTKRTDGELWRHCAEMELPDTLKHKLDSFAATGKVPLYSEESYQEPSWVSILVGNGLIPRSYQPLVDMLPEQEVSRIMAGRREELARIAETMPPHQAFIDRFCRAPAR
jgi:tryptophan halogenase